MDNTKMNNDIQGWAKKTNSDLKSEFDRLNIVHLPRSPNPTPSKDNLTNSFARMQGKISRIGFKFRRSMVFVSKGVGKGVPAALAGSSKTTRKPKDWFNSVIDKKIEQLADIVGENSGDTIVNNLNIK